MIIVLFLCVAYPMKYLAMHIVVVLDGHLETVKWNGGME